MTPAGQLAACGLPAAWAGQRQWRILDTQFGAGARFTAAWQAWRSDPRRPRLLHYAALTAAPASIADILAAGNEAGCSDLAMHLAGAWWGLLPGFHRLVFDDGRVLLTLSVGETARGMRDHAFEADSVLLGGDGWPAELARPLARLCRRGTVLSGDGHAPAAQAELQSAGFTVDDRAEGWRARFEPAWTLKRPPLGSGVPADCVVVGAGLAGAAAAASLARRGWRVRVLDAAAHAAAGASALPAGLMAPHQSPDDNLLSQLTRAGIRISLQEMRMLQRGEDWDLTGVLERRGDHASPPGGADEAWAPWTQPASESQKEQASFDPGRPAWWHAQAGWVKPAALVRGWLSAPGITFTGGLRVERILREEDQWRLQGPDGRTLAQATLVVVAAANASAGLVGGTIATRPVRGQVSWNLRGATCGALPAFPLNGNGHLIPRVPTVDGDAWLAGSTYGRGDDDAAPRAEDHASNLLRLRDLAPAAAAAMAVDFEGGQVKAWAGVRCASTDRRPLVGEVAPGLWVSTALGSRGLSFAALCAELMAARLHGEPLPVALPLAQALAAARQLKGS